MSALNYRNQIILDEDNYPAWRQRTWLILRAEKVAACVLWEPHRLARKWPPDEAAAKEQRARQILRLLVGARLWTKAASRRAECAHDIWTELERRHARRLKANLNQQVSELLLQLGAYKMASSRPPNVVHASLELVNIFEKLKALGSPLSDDDKIKCVIGALPSHYQEPLSVYLAGCRQHCACFSLKNLQQLIVMVSRIAEAEASGHAEPLEDKPGEMGDKQRDHDDSYTNNLAAICCQSREQPKETKDDDDNIEEANREQEQEEPKFCQTITDDRQGVIVHSETIRSPDADLSSAWSPTNKNSCSQTQRISPETKFPCCRPGRLCDPRLHRVHEKTQFKPQLKKREYKIPHIVKPTSPTSQAASNDDKSKQLKKADDEDEEDEDLLGKTEIGPDGRKFKRVRFIFSSNHRLNIVNDMSILYKYEAITPFDILMKDNTTVKAKHRGYVRSDSGSFSVFYVPTSDNNYLSIKAMNSKFYLPPKPGEQDYSDMRIRDMVKFNRLKDSAKIILKVNLPTHHHHNKSPFPLKRHYKQSQHHQQPQLQPYKRHKHFHNQSKSPSTSASASPEQDNNNSFDTSQNHISKTEHSFVYISNMNQDDDDGNKTTCDETNTTAEGKDQSKVEWIIDVEDAEEEYEPGLAYDVYASMERNKMLSPSFR